LQELNTETIEQETGKNVEMDLTTQVSVGVCVGIFIIVIGVVLVVVIVRRRRRTGNFSPILKK
jgi:heme/copper-type cytochrome/quinol oxidase subunit 2